VRLSQHDTAIILSTIKNRIPDAEVFLFGSRADDNRKGGDIDIFLNTSNTVTVSEKMKLLVQLERKGIQRRVDLIIQTPEKQKPTLYHEVITKGIRLC
jgi:predicted nucleotidyltransferase